MDKQHEQMYQEKLERSGAFEQMINTKGWDLLKTFIENRIKSFGSDTIQKGYSSFEEFNFARGEVSGLLKIIQEVDDHLQTLYDYRSKQSANTK